MVTKLNESIIDYEKQMNIAAIISENNKGELEAIQGYQELLAIINEEDQEAVEVIEEIISDEKNHIERLNELMLKYDKIEPSKD